MNSDDQIQEIASRVIKGWRTQKQMSQAELASQLGMHQTAIAKIESGERKIDLATAVRISRILEIPWQEFNTEELTEVEKVIRALNKFVMSGDKFVESLKLVSGAAHEHQAALEECLVVLGPARLPQTEALTAKSVNGAAQLMLDVTRHIQDLAPKWNTDEVLSLMQDLDDLRQFLFEIELERARDSSS